MSDNTLRRPTRRQFMRTLGVAAAGSVVGPSGAWASGRIGIGRTGPMTSDVVEDPDLTALAHRALDAATAAGASYADIRFTRTLRQQANTLGIRESELLMTGVRALVNGAWGFAAHAECTPESMVFLGRTAAALGQANAWPHLPPITLGDRTPSTGTWQTPVTRDPFTVSPQERAELYARFSAAIEAAGGAAISLQANFERQDRTFLSTEGASTQQSVYTAFSRQESNREFKSDAEFVVAVQNGSSYPSSLVSPVGQGYEALTALEAEIPVLVERALAVGDATPLDSPGRYDVVFDGYAVAALISALGNALEIDRALGYEAESLGTSYLAPLSQQLGTSPLPPSVTIMADRTMPSGAATVQWDDEGVAAQAFPLVQSGVLTDYSTGREFVSELADWYQRQGRPLRSHGCMTAENAKGMPLVQTPNLILAPSATDTTFDALLSGIDNGFAILGGDVRMDQQLLTGLGRGTVMYAVKRGKLAGAVKGAAYTFRMPDLWKQLVALGGPRSAVTRGFQQTKGQPVQTLPYSVRAVAARFRDVAIRSVGRR